MVGRALVREVRAARQRLVHGEVLLVREDGAQVEALHVEDGAEEAFIKHVAQVARDAAGGEAAAPSDLTRSGSIPPA